MNPTQLPVPPLPTAGETITHQQAAFFAHLAGMHASNQAEAGTNPGAKSALLAAARCEAPRPAGTLSPLTVSMIWALEDLGNLFADIQQRPLDDLALSYLLFSDPELTLNLIEAKDAMALMHTARAAIAPLTIPELNIAKEHIAREMAQLRTEEKKPQAATDPSPPGAGESARSSPIAPPPVMDGPSLSSSSSWQSTASPSTPPSTASPSMLASPCSPAELSASASSARA
jgi:hypothetical protein